MLKVTIAGNGQRISAYILEMNLISYLLRTGMRLTCPLPFSNPSNGALNAHWKSRQSWRVFSTWSPHVSCWGVSPVLVKTHYNKCSTFSCRSNLFNLLNPSRQYSTRVCRCILLRVIWSEPHWALLRYKSHVHHRFIIISYTDEPHWALALKSHVHNRFIHNQLHREALALKDPCSQ